MSKKNKRDPKRQAKIDQKKENKKLRQLIRTGNDPILTTVCDHIIPTSPEAKRIAHTLLKVTMACDTAVGLAAPQIGENARMCVIWPNRFRDQMSRGFVMCNPVIFGHSQAIDVQIEGCLSFPGKQVAVQRFQSIDVKWVDLEGKEQWGTFEGWEARVIQHELDHLDGVCRVGHDDPNAPVVSNEIEEIAPPATSGPYVEQKAEPGVPLRRYTPRPSASLLTAAALAGAMALPSSR